MLAGRLLTEVLSSLKTSHSGDRVVMQLETKRNYVDLFSLAAKAVTAARQQAPIVESENNLRQLALAMHNYHDTYLALPSHANYGRKDDAKGAAKPLLSWRVHLLPFVERVDLYEQFRFDEPWDSDHNKKLIAKMPSIYRSPGLELGEGKTCYVVPVGADTKYGTMFPPGATTANTGRVAKGQHGFSTIIDGTANTLMILEVPPQKAVTWTRPDDWEVDVKDAKKGLFVLCAGFLLAALGDGSVHRITERASAEAVRRLLGVRDGEFVEIEEVILNYGSGHDHGRSIRKASKSAAPKAVDKVPFGAPESRAEPAKERAVPPPRKE